MVIQILNFTSNHTINYSLPLIKAKLIPSCSCTGITAINGSNGYTQSWPVNRTLLKCFVPLNVGANNIRLHCLHNAIDVSLTFSPSQRQTRVRLIYIVARDSDGTFQAPADEDSSIDSALRRIRLASLLLQSATAELLYSAGLGRKTFQFVVDQDQQPIIDKFECSLSMSEAHRLSCDQLWMSLARELAMRYGDEIEWVKWMGFMSFTRYEVGNGPTPRSHQEVMDRTRGHCALGGGGLALFGTGNLYSWAENLGELPERLHDNRRVDRRHLMDDSAFRGTYWGNFATGLGATLHELGHTFDLSHTADGVMQRGGDDINLLFSYPPRAAPPCRQCCRRSPQPSVFRAPKDAHQVEVDHGETARRYLQFEAGFVQVYALACRERQGELESRGAVLMRQRPVTQETLRRGMEFGKCESLDHHGRASFARSSAVLLAFHRWFRDDVASVDFCLRISRTELLADKGLRTVEFIADGVVATHWEFTHDPAPTLLPLGTSMLREMCPNVNHLVVTAEDNEGHVYKARVRIDQFGESPALSPA